MSTIICTYQGIFLTTSPAKLSRAFYGASIADFIHSERNSVLGRITENSGFSIETTQRDAWRSQITILQHELLSFTGRGANFSGLFNVRTGSELHRKAYLRAMKDDATINRVVVAALDKYLAT